MKEIYNYDYLSVSVKTDSENEMVARYGVFGWELVGRFDDKKFSDIAVIDFRRPHAIANKDRLQYLQVGMETAVNNLSKYKQNKHGFSLALGISCGVFSCALLAGGIMLIILSALWSIVIGCLMNVVAIVLVVVVLVVLKKLIPKENLRYDTVFEKIQSELLVIEKEAVALVGESNGRKDD